MNFIRLYTLAFLTLFLACVMPAHVSAQNNTAPNVTLKVTRVTLDQLFKQLEETTGYQFRYTDDVINDPQRFSYNFTDEPLGNVLDRIAQDSDLEYRIDGKNISLRKAKQQTVTGRVTNADGTPLPGVAVTINGTAASTSTDAEGNYSLSATRGALLEFSSIGMETQEVAYTGQPRIDVVMNEGAVGLEEVVVVGYGVQKKRDITGTVASLPQERLEMVPNVNLTQAIQGAIPGVMVQTSTAGAASSASIMMRGRKSIKASNSPLVVVDGVVGSLADLSPGDVASIEVLKDASASAIYGSRGSNGVILVTTKSGTGGKPKLKYNGYYSLQRFINLPDLMNGLEFYDFKMERNADGFTPSELDIYESGNWVDWVDLALRNGKSTQHNLSLSGGFKETKYYISANVTDITGLAVKDDYLKLSSRVNVDTKLGGWLTVGTRTQLSYDDEAGIPPTWDGDQGVFWFNPLTTAYDENGELTIYPWPEDTYFRNPLMNTLASNVNESYQMVSNNYAVVDFPFLKGLQYRVNAGVRLGFTNTATYYGKDTQRGLANRGDANTGRGLSRNIVIENIVNYNREFGKHNLFLTGVYSFENSRSGSNTLDAQGFPNDFLTWYSAAQAESIVPGYSHNETSLLSAMGRINYAYDSRYLLTLTGRSDGYSGFGVQRKRAFFPSLAVGWNLSNEDFFNWDDVVNQLKLRASVGLSGNQAIGAYETISRLSSADIVAGSTTLPGYVPSKLGQDNLGWESTKTWNVGLDLGFLNNRITAEINAYRSNTKDLLLDRAISPVHAVSSITQNIGETQNNGYELSFVSRNIVGEKFSWETFGNISFVKNKIVSLYGNLDENGRELDDVANAWFIGKPILVNYGYKWDGVWQLDEAEQAAAYGTQPGYIKIRDVSGPDGVPDGVLSPDYDRMIIGQRDPKYIWGMNNSFSYKNLTLRIFIHGVHGVTKNNTLLNDTDVDENVRMTTTKKNWWRPDNPTNDWYMNHNDAHLQNGVSAAPYEKAGFVRIKDISLSYDLAKDFLSRFGFEKLQVYVTGRNLATFTQFGGMDPELSGQRNIPLQKEYVFGLNIDF